MKRNLIHLLLVAASLGLASATFADRPSYSDLDARQTQLEAEQARDRAAICAKADADGESYRPFVCTPRCDCFDPQAFASVSSCTEGSAGDFSIAATLPAGTCSIDRCVGDPGLFAWCTSNPPVVCQDDSDCTGIGPETCNAFGLCEDPTLWCQTDDDCNDPLWCDTSSYATCTFDSDCPLLGETCVPDGLTQTSACLRFCSTDTDCPAPAVAIDLTGVGSVDSPAVASCNASYPPASVSINANDALECIVQAESLLGAQCN